MTKNKKSENGMSLVEVMVAIGMLGLISMGTMKIMQTASKGSKKLSTTNNIFQLMYRAEKALATERGCLKTLNINATTTGSQAQELDPTDPTAARFEVDTNAYQNWPSSGNVDDINCSLSGMQLDEIWRSQARTSTSPQPIILRRNDVYGQGTGALIQISDIQFIGEQIVAEGDLYEGAICITFQMVTGDGTTNLDNSQTFGGTTFTRKIPILYQSVAANGSGDGGDGVLETIDTCSIDKLTYVEAACDSLGGTYDTDTSQCENITIQTDAIGTPNDGDGSDDGLGSAAPIVSKAAINAYGNVGIGNNMVICGSVAIGETDAKVRSIFGQNDSSTNELPDGGGGNGDFRLTPLSPNCSPTGGGTPESPYVTDANNSPGQLIVGGDISFGQVLYGPQGYIEELLTVGYDGDSSNTTNLGTGTLQVNGNVIVQGAGDVLIPEGNVEAIDAIVTNAKIGYTDGVGIDKGGLYVAGETFIKNDSNFGGQIILGNVNANSISGVKLKIGLESGSTPFIEYDDELQFKEKDSSGSGQIYFDGTVYANQFPNWSSDTQQYLQNSPDILATKSYVDNIVLSQMTDEQKADLFQILYEEADAVGLVAIRRNVFDNIKLRDDHNNLSYVDLKTVSPQTLTCDDNNTYHISEIRFEHNDGTLKIRTACHENRLSDAYLEDLEEDNLSNGFVSEDSWRYSGTNWSSDGGTVSRSKGFIRLFKTAKHFTQDLVNAVEEFQNVQSCDDTPIGSFCCGEGTQASCRDSLGTLSNSASVPWVIGGDPNNCASEGLLLRGTGDTTTRYCIYMRIR